MKLFSETNKFSIYAWARFYIWMALLTACVVVPFLLVYYAQLLTLQSYELSWLNLHPRLITLGMFFFLIGVISLLMRPILRKVFFKKYKKFEVQSDIKEISWKFSSLVSLKYVIALRVVNSLVRSGLCLFYPEIKDPLCFILLDPVSDVDALGFHVLLVGWLDVIANLVVSYFVVRSVVRKHITVTKKESVSLSWKYAIYPFARYCLWVYGLVLAGLSIILLATALATNRFEDSLLDGIVPPLILLFTIVGGFWINKYALNRVFFTKYKRFSLVTNISEVSNRLALKTWALFLCLSLICIAWGGAIAFAVACFSQYLTLSWAICLFAILPALLIEYMIIKLCVERHVSAMIKKQI